MKNTDVEKVSVALGNSYVGIDGLVDSYKESELTLGVTGKDDISPKVHYYEDLGILRILADGDRGKEKGLQTISSTVSMIPRF